MKTVQQIYSTEASYYWDSEYKKNGYKVVHDAGTEQKTKDLAEREIDLFLWPTEEKCLSLLNDKENNPYPTFWEDFHLEHKSIDELLPNLNECTALDYGCGILGRYTISLSKYFKSVIGIDISGEAVKGAREQARSRNIKNVSFIRNDGLKIPLATNSIDFIFSNLVLQHIGYAEGLKEIVSEFARILSHKGIGRVEYLDSSQRRSIDFFSVVEGTGLSVQQLNNIYNEYGLEIISHSDRHPYGWLTFKKIK